MTRNDRIAVWSRLDCFVYDAGLRRFALRGRKGKGVESMDREYFAVALIDYR